MNLQARPRPYRPPANNPAPVYQQQPQQPQPQYSQGTYPQQPLYSAPQPQLQQQQQPLYGQQPLQQQQQQHPYQAQGQQYFQSQGQQSMQQQPYSQQQPLLQQHQQQQQPQQPPGSSHTTQQPNFLGSNILSDPTAQLASQLGTHAFSQGQEIVHQNISKFINVPALKYYFHVSNGYVGQKLLLLLFPFRNKMWTRLVNRSESDGAMQSYKFPTQDVNAPDIYIPLMSYVTLVLFGTVLAQKAGSSSGGQVQSFNPEVMGMRASTAAFLILGETGFLRLGCYLLNVQGSPPLLDIVAYSSYKFVGVLAVLAVRFIGVVMFGGVRWWIVYAAFLYTGIAFGFFTLRTLKYIVLPEIGSATTVSPIRKRRIQFLFVVAAVQMFTSWLLI